MNEQQSHDNDPLDPIKIRHDVAPASETRIKDKVDRAKLFKFASMTSLLLAVILFVTVVFWHPNPLPSIDELVALPTDQVTLYSEPMGAKIYRPAIGNEPDYLGVTGTALPLKELIPHYREPGNEKAWDAEPEPNSVNFEFKKTGFSDTSVSIPTIELKNRIYPQTEDKLIQLRAANPGAYIWYYLRGERPLFFLLICLSLVLCAGFGVLYRKEKAWLEKRERLREQDKDKDPLTGLSVLGHQVLEKLGRGGTAVIYRAVSEKDYRTHRAVRFCREDVLDEKLIKNWQRESGAYQAMDHPNVIKVLDTKQFKNTFVFIMELIEGENLDQFLAKNKPMQPKQALELFERIASGLDHAHSKGIVHRDIKPANVMIRPDSSAILVDFGLATDERVKVTKTFAIKGTIFYMSPEQAGGSGEVEYSDTPKELQHYTDQFSLGLMLYEALSDDFPYDDVPQFQALYERQAGTPKPFFKAAPQYGEEVSMALMKMLAVKETERYSSCGEAISAVKKAFYSRLSPE